MNNNKLYPRLAVENIKKNGKNYIPYIITCVLTVAMFYIIGSLATNPGLLSMKVGGNIMPVILSFGTVVVGLFAVIFLFYTNSFLIKRRKKEFALYHILGMGKRHIAKVVSLETLYVEIIGIVLGLGVGIALDKLLYLAIAKILGEEVSLGFYISIPSIITTILLFGILFLLILLNSLRQIVLSNPVELLKGGNVGEKEPKTKWIMTVLGIICLGVGYYMAITVENPAIAIGIFFIAVILVIAGTYMLFTAGSIFLLKALRKNKRYYYKPKHFISVSGMIYRMKQNAVGLANICILSTMVLVMISCTSALMIGIDDTINKAYPYDLSITFYHPYQENGEGLEALEKSENLAQKYSADLEEAGNYTNLNLTAYISGDSYSLTDSNSEKLEMNIILSEEHNKYSGDNLTLNDNEIYIYAVNTEYNYPTMTIFGKRYTVKGVQATKDSNDVYSYLTVFVKDIDVLREINDNVNIEFGDIDNSTRFNRVFQYNITNKNKSEEIISAFNRMAEKAPVIVIDKKEAHNDFAGLYGGLLFLGLFLGTLFIMATILIIYYKQISEGYEDQNRFDIMQKVGMSKEEVKSAIHSQILCVFFLPLITAGIHTGFAFNIVLKCMNVLGFSNINLYLLCVAVCFLAFAAMYTVIYLITARTYYKIVSR